MAVRRQPRKLNILLSAVGSPGAPGIIRSLRRMHGFRPRLIGLDTNPDCAGAAMVERFYVNRKPSDPGYIGNLLRICRKERIAVFMDWVDPELLALSENKPLFEKTGVYLALSDPAGLRVACDKFLLMRECRKIGVPVPAFALARDVKEFERACRLLGYPGRPVCFKPLDSHGSRGFRIINPGGDRYRLLMENKPDGRIADYDDIVKVLGSAKGKSFRPLLVMEYVDGAEYSVDVLADRGVPLVVIPRRRDRTVGGISVVSSLENDREMIGYSKKLVERLGLHSNVGFQFIRDNEGIPRLIEANPRPQGTTVICTAAGANLIEDAVRLGLGLRPRSSQKRINWDVRMIRHWDEVYFDRRKGGFFKI